MINLIAACLALPLIATGLLALFSAILLFYSLKNFLTFRKSYRAGYIFTDMAQLLPRSIKQNRLAIFACWLLIFAAPLFGNFWQTELLVYGLVGLMLLLLFFFWLFNRSFGKNQRLAAEIMCGKENFDSDAAWDLKHLEWPKTKAKLIHAFVFSLAIIFIVWSLLIGLLFFAPRR